MRKKLPTRVGSVLLSFTMLLSLLPVTAFADDTPQYVAQISDQTYETLQGAVDDVPADGSETTITLISDITDVTLAPTDTTLTLATVSAGQNITLDLDGHTIEATLTTNGNTYGMAQVIRNEGTLTIVDSSENESGSIIADTSYGCTATIRNDGEDSILTIESGTISSHNGNVIRNQNGLLTINGGTFTTTGQSANFDNGTAAIHNRGDAVIKGGDFSTEYQAPMWYGAGTDNSTTVIKGGTFTSENSGVDIQGSSGSVTVTGGQFHVSPADYVAPGYYVSQTDDYYVVESAGSSVVVTTFDELKSVLETSTSTVDISVSGVVTVTEDLTIPATTTLTVNDGAVLAVQDAVLTLDGYLINQGTLDVSQIGTGFISNLIRYLDEGGSVTGLPTDTNGVYEIGTAAQLQMMHFVLLEEADDNGVFHGDITLTNDIDLEGYNFMPLGYDFVTAFSGTLDGKGHAISNLTINLAAGYIGLFSVTENAHFQNLTVSNAQLTTQSGRMGTLTGDLYGSSNFVNVTVSGSYYNASSYYCGGWIGYMGGAEGSAHNFVNCHNEMDVTGSYNVGAFWGSSSGSKAYVTMINCSNHGNVTATGGTIGVIGGYAYNDGILYNFTNSGTITNQGSVVSNPNWFNGNNPTNNILQGDIVAMRYGSDGRMIPYTAFSDAVSEAQDGDTIELLADAALTEPLVIDENITIDGQNQYTITGHTKLQNGTLKDLTLTTTGASLLTIGSGAETTIRMDGVTVKYPVSGTAAGTVSVLDGNNADIAISGCTFMNEADNGGVTEGASQWSYGLYMNDQGSSGSFTMTGSRFDGAFRTMLANINGTVTIEGNHFANSIFSNNSGSTSGSGEEATCITTGNAAVNNISITENTFDNAGAFYFQKTANVTVQDNTFKSEKFEHYIQVSGGAGQALDLTDNTFNMGDNDLVTVDVTAAPVLLPAGQKAVSYWAWSDTDAAIRPADYSSYVYAYDEDGNKVFYPASDAALGAFLNPVSGNIGLQANDTMEIQQNLTLTSDAAIPDGAVLVIDNNATLVIAEGSTLTNNGTIINPEQISGAVSSGETAVVKQTVRFQITPAAAQLVVKDLNGAVIAPEADHLYYLADGSYTYTVSAQGYYAQSKTFTVSGQAQTISVSLIQVPSDTGSSSVDSSDGEYFISVSKPTGGKVTVNPGWADKGDTVTITVTPNSGYELSEITVTDSKGDELKLFTKDGSKYTFTMPSSKVEIEVSFTASVQTPTNPFTDVNTSDYYYNAVLWAVENGVTSGTSATTFGPNVTVTRAQMMTFLWRAHGSPKATGTNPFTDVSSSDYYYDAVLWAVKSGITSGMSATTFGPDNAVTRAQAVTFQWLAAGSPAVSGDSFGDVSADAYYANAVAWAVAKSITGGTGNNQFSPDMAVSRAQAVTFLYQELG